MAPVTQTFETFFQDPIYLLYKNHLYNYLCRRHVIRRIWRATPLGWTLELGCGVSPMLEPQARVVQTDFSWRALNHLRTQSRFGRTRFRPVACDATRLPFPNGVFDHVICSEVLEHLEEDQQALKEISRSLKPGGELCLTCPIHPEHFGFDDEFVGHYRRYEVSSLLADLKKVGFEVLETRPILGPLEKRVMEFLTRLFSRLGKGRRGSLGERGIRWLAWLVFPFYLIVNYFLAFCVYLEAHRASPQDVLNLGIRCRKVA